MSEAKAPEETKDAKPTKRRRVGAPPDPQLVQTLASPLRMPTAISSLVFSFLPLLESLPDVPFDLPAGAAETKVADVRGNTKLVCKEMKRRVMIALKENKVEHLIFDATWEPVVSMNGLHAVALALAEQIDAGKVRRWSIRQCDRALEHGRDFELFVGRFRNLTEFVFVADKTQFRITVGVLRCFRAILQMRFLEDFRIDLALVLTHGGASLSGLHVDIAAGRAPLTSLRLSGMNGNGGQPNVRPLVTWSRMEHLRVLFLDVSLGDPDLSRALVKCRKLETCQLFLHAGQFTDVALDINRYVHDIAVALAEGKNPLRKVRVHVLGDGREMERDVEREEPYMSHVTALVAWLSFRRLRRFRLSYSQSLDEYLAEASPTLQSVVYRMLTEWTLLEELYVGCEVTASFLADTATVAPKCAIAGLLLGGDHADITALALWTQQHPLAHVPPHATWRYSLSGDVKEIPWGFWNSLGDVLVGNEGGATMQFVSPIALSAFVSGFFATCGDADAFTMVGQPIGDHKSALKIDGIVVWEDLPAHLCLLGTLALSPAFFDDVYDQNRSRLLVLARTDDATRQFILSRSGSKVLIDVDLMENTFSAAHEGLPPSLSGAELVKALYAVESGEFKDKWTFATPMSGGVNARALSWRLAGTEVVVRYVEASTTKYTDDHVWHAVKAGDAFSSDDED